VTTTEMLVPMRHTTHTTKADAREHWKEQMAEGLMAMCIAFLCEVMLAVPTVAFNSWKMFAAVVVMFVAITMAAGRVTYTIYKYVRI
jgi:hypothetical protein